MGTISSFPSVLSWSSYWYGPHLHGRAKRSNSQWNQRNQWIGHELHGGLCKVWDACRAPRDVHASAVIALALHPELLLPRVVEVKHLDLEPETCDYDRVDPGVA